MTNRTTNRVALGALLILTTTLGACSRDPEATKAKYFASGNTYFEKKQYREAIVEYRNAIKVDPKFGEARLKLAASYMQTGELANGLQEQIRGADLLPQDADAQIAAGNLLLLAGRFEDAKARAAAVLQANPSSVGAQILLGNSLAGLKDFDGAIGEIEEALKLDPERVSTYANLGTLQLAQGHRAVAEETFKRAVEKDPASVPARLALGNFYWAIGQTADAERHLLSVATSAPDDPRVNRAMANFLLSTKKVAEAERYLVNLARVDPSAGSSLTLADYYVAVGRPNEAIPLLKSITEDRAMTLAQVRLAGIEVHARRYTEAEQIVDTVLAKNGSDTEALLLKAAIVGSRGKLPEAVELARKAVEANPRSARAQFALGKLALLQRRPDDAQKAFTETLRLNPRAADAQTELARLHLASGAVSTGVDFATQAVKNDPSSIDARLVLARGFAAKQDLPKAQQILTDLATAYPKSAVARSQLGLVLALRGDRAAAVRNFDEALAIDPDHLDATAGLVSLDLTLRQFDAAKARVAARVARTPNSADAVLLAGKTYAATGDLKTAEESMRKALELDPANLSGYEALGRLLVKTNRLQEAVAEFQALASKQRSPVAALTMIGMLQEALKEPAEAQRAYERALEFDRNAAVAANNLAWIYVNGGGSLDAALQLAKNAKAVLPKQPEIGDTLGWIYYKKGLFSLAIGELKAVVERDPSNPSYQYHLGAAYAANGNRNEARRALEAALRLRPDFDGAADANRVLSTL